MTAYLAIHFSSFLVLFLCFGLVGIVGFFLGEACAAQKISRLHSFIAVLLASVMGMVVLAIFL